MPNRKVNGRKKVGVIIPKDTFSKQKKYIRFRRTVTEFRLVGSRAQQINRLTLGQMMLAKLVEEIRKGGHRQIILGQPPRNEIRDLENESDEFQNQIDFLIQKEEAEKRLAFQNSIKSTKGTRGDGNTYIHFVNVGLGDCTAITSPKGAVFLMDLGSTGTADIEPRDGSDEDEMSVDSDDEERMDVDTQDLKSQRIGNLLSALTSKKFLGSNLRKIHCLILSHIDDDHHNLLTKVLGNRVDSVGMVYFGGTDDISDYAGGATDFLNNLSGEEVIKNTSATVIQHPKTHKALCKLGDDEVTKTKGKPNIMGYEFKGADGNLVLYTETDDDDDEIFRVSVLASNVARAVDKDDDGDDYWVKTENNLNTSYSRTPSTPTNRGSLVLLVETPDSKVLICSDATALTERSMVNLFGSILKDVTHVRIPHHASDTSSSVAFLSKLKKMDTAVASCPGEFTMKHHLPKYAILQLYYNQLKDNQMLKHNIWSWQKNDSKPKLYHKDITRKLLATGTNGNYLITP